MRDSQPIPSTDRHLMGLMICPRCREYVRSCGAGEARPPAGDESPAARGMGAAVAFAARWVRRQLADPLVDPDVDSVARVLADRLAQAALTGSLCVPSPAPSGAGKRFAIDRAADLHEPAGTEELGHIVDHNARPRTEVVALLSSASTLSTLFLRLWHAAELIASLFISCSCFRGCNDHLDAVDEDPGKHGKNVCRGSSGVEACVQSCGATYRQGRRRLAVLFCSRPISGGTADDDRVPDHRRLQLRGRAVRGDSAARARELLPLQALPASERSRCVS